MIKKSDVQNIMDALMIRHWGIFLISDAIERMFVVQNSIFDVPELEDAIVIAIAVPYRISSQHSRPSMQFGKVESFAWGYDYHVEVKSRLERVVKRLDELVDKHFYNVIYCVDNSPFNDREVAFHAGLGKVGYNHLLIHPTYGSQFFIGYVIIKDGSTVFESYKQEADRNIKHPFCASCGRCIMACPTGVCGSEDADMTFCLSSLTQTKASIDEALQIKMGFTLYGCSICQKVCPLNRRLEGDDVLTSEKSNWIDLFELLDMSEAAFKNKYGKMGFSWRSLWIYKRNALIILGNTINLTILKKLKSYKHIESNPKLSSYYNAAINRLEKAIFEESDTF